MKKLLFIFIPIILFSCTENKVKDTSWYCKVNDNSCKIEFITHNKGILIRKNPNYEQTIPFTYEVENSNIVMSVKPASGIVVLYDIATIENDNCLKLRTEFNGICFTKIK